VNPLPDCVNTATTAAVADLTGKSIDLFIGDINNYEFLKLALHEFEPEAISVEQRSAPFR